MGKKATIVHSLYHLIILLLVPVNENIESFGSNDLEPHPCHIQLQVVAPTNKVLTVPQRSFLKHLYTSSDYMEATASSQQDVLQSPSSSRPLTRGPCCPRTTAKRNDAPGQLDGSSRRSSCSSYRNWNGTLYTMRW